MAFGKPDMTFTPGSFANTGVQYLDQYYNTVKSNIAVLKSKGVLPFARVQLSTRLCCGVLSMTPAALQERACCWLLVAQPIRTGPPLLRMLRDSTC